MLKKILQTSLIELITVSEIKRQIVWTQDLLYALQLMNAIARSSFVDKELGILQSKINELKEYAFRYSSFGGYRTLMEKIDAHFDSLKKQ